MKTPNFEIPGSVGASMHVRYKTELVDDVTGEVTPLQEGHNMVTDIMMNFMGADSGFSTSIATCQTYATAVVIKRVGGVSDLVTPVATTAASIAVTCNNGFFVAGDVGRSLKIAGWPELLITAFTSTTVVTCSCRNGAYPAGFTPSATPVAVFGVHYTNLIKAYLGTLGLDLTAFDTSISGYNSEAYDNTANCFVAKRVWLSSAVTGSPVTVNMLAWGYAANSTPLGVATLSTTDTIPVGKKYRVTAYYYTVVTGLSLTGVTMNLGPTIGTYTVDIMTENIDMTSGYASFIDPINDGTSRLPGYGTGYTFTAAFSLVATPQYNGKTGHTFPTALPGSGATIVACTVDFNGSYAAGSFNRVRRISVPSAGTHTSCTGFCVAIFAGGYKMRLMTFKFTSGLYNKPNLYSWTASFGLDWTRELVN